jgi:argininosuccinate lyase
MQEDKEATFDAIDTVNTCLHLFCGMLRTITFNPSVMAASAVKGFTNATDAADYLVGKGVPFRDAHEIIGKLVLYCIEQHAAIEELSLDQLKAISPVFADDIYEAVALSTCVEKRLTIGAPGLEAMKAVLSINRDHLANYWAIPTE